MHSFTILSMAASALAIVGDTPDYGVPGLTSDLIPGYDHDQTHTSASLAFSTYQPDTSTGGPSFTTFTDDLTATHGSAGCCDTPGYCSCPWTPIPTIIIIGTTTITYTPGATTTPLGATKTVTVTKDDCVVTGTTVPGFKGTTVPGFTGTIVPDPKGTTVSGFTGTPTIITIGTTTYTVPTQPKVTTTAPPPIATFCLSPQGYSSECVFSTLAATTYSCSGSYFNGACQCPCGAYCSCPAGSMTTSTRLFTAY